jgi:hypothetical protein
LESKKKTRNYELWRKPRELRGLEREIRNNEIKSDKKKKRNRKKLVEESKVTRGLGGEKVELLVWGFVSFNVCTRRILGGEIWGFLYPSFCS